MYTTGRRYSSLHDAEYIEKEAEDQRWNNCTKIRNKKSKTKKTKKSKKTKNGINKVNKDGAMKIRLQGQPKDDVKLTQTSSKKRAAAATYDDDDDDPLNSVEAVFSFTRNVFGAKKRNKNMKRKKANNETKSKTRKRNDDDDDDDNDDNHRNFAEDILPKNAFGSRKRNIKTNRNKVSNGTKSKEGVGKKKEQPASWSKRDISVESTASLAERKVVECSPKTIRLDIQLPANACMTENHVAFQRQVRDGCQLSRNCSEECDGRWKKSVEIKKSFGNFSVHVTIHCDDVVAAAADDDVDDTNDATDYSETRTPSEETKHPVNHARNLHACTRTRHGTARPTNSFVHCTESDAARRFDHPRTSHINRLRKERPSGVYIDDETPDPCHEACRTATTMPLPEPQWTQSEPDPYSLHQTFTAATESPELRWRENRRNPDSVHEAEVTAVLPELGRPDLQHQRTTSPDNSYYAAVWSLAADIRRILCKQKQTLDRYSEELNAMLSQYRREDQPNLRPEPEITGAQEWAGHKQVVESLKGTGSGKMAENKKTRMWSKTMANRNSVDGDGAMNDVEGQPVNHKDLCPTFRRDRAVAAAAADDNDDVGDYDDDHDGNQCT